jgi:hypothetical protein
VCTDEPSEPMGGGGESSGHPRSRKVYCPEL